MLGSLSEKYEVGTRGCGTVSTGVGNDGEISYGSYQMTSNPNGGTVTKFVLQDKFPFKNEFKNLIAGTEEFTKVWKNIALLHKEEFFKLQHNYIKNNLFDKLVNKIKTERQLYITNHSLALQNVVWSVAVQHGQNTNLINKAIDTLLKDKSSKINFDTSLIRAIYTERMRKNEQGSLVYFSKSSSNVQKGLINRFINEEKDALEMLKN